MIYGFLGVAAIALAAAHEGMGGLVVHDAMTNPSLEYDKTRWGDATWKEEEVSKAAARSRPLRTAMHLCSHHPRPTTV